MNFEKVLGIGGLVVTFILSLCVLYLDARKQNGRHK